MISPRVEELGFLTRPENKGVLLLFPKETKKSLAHQVTNFLLTCSPNIHNEIFASHDHIYFYMEIVGHSFNLDVSDAAIIDNAIELYRRWLFDDSRSPLLKEKEFYYILVTILFLSLILFVLC